MVTVTARNALCLAFLLASLNGVILHLLLSWAFNKSNKVFFGTLFGGMGWKFLTLGLTTFFVFGNPSYSLVTTLLSFVFFSTFFTFLSVWILGQVRETLVSNVSRTCPKI